MNEYKAGARFKCIKTFTLSFRNGKSGRLDTQAEIVELVEIYSDGTGIHYKMPDGFWVKATIAHFKEHYIPV